MTCGRSALLCIHTASYAAIWSAVVMRRLLLLLLSLKPPCSMAAKDRLCFASSCCKPVPGARFPSESRHTRGRTPHSGTQPGSDLHLNCTSLRVASLTENSSSLSLGAKRHTLGSTSTWSHLPTR